jgi:HK97 family phage prohead protease
MNKNEYLHGMVMNREMAARADAANVDEEKRTVELSFSSEEPYERFFGPEILDHAEGAVDLTRLEEIGTMLFNHDADHPIGGILKVWIGEDHRGHALVKFDTDEESEKIYQKVLGGSLKGVSVGYRIHEWEELDEDEKSKDGRFVGPAIVATKWEPLEISIVSVPADATVGVGRSIEIQEENQEMEGNNNINQEEIRAQAVEAERKRAAEITALCRDFDMSPDAYIAEGKSVEETRAAVLDALKKKSAPTQVTVTADEKEKYRAAAADGIALRAGIAVAKPAEGAESFRGMSLLRLAEDMFERETGKSGRMAQDELVRSVLSGGTGAFPSIMANVAHKALEKSYEEAPTTFQYWTAKGSNPDFKPALRVGLGAADELVEMTEGGEFKNAESTDYGKETSVSTYGREWMLTRKAIINDDLGALTRLPAMYGAAAKRTINKKVYELLAAGAMFSKANGNLGAGAISIEALKAAKAAMAKQMDPSGKTYLNLQPAYLVVPSELEVEAATLIASAVDPTKSNAYPNPFANKLTVVADPNLTDASAWYLAAAPGILPGIEVTYLNGAETPTLRTFVDTDALGIKYQIFHDFGVNLLDFRALYKSTGK